MIRIFKTNVQTKKDARFLLKKLQAYFPSGKINFDLQDCDKILRAELADCDAASIIAIINGSGFSCVELD
jgi:hypothetical protein